MSTNFRNKSASQHNFAMVPKADIPRSRYLLQQNRKQTFDAGDLVPIYCEEMLPGDHFKGHTSIFARLATPVVPVLDNAELETFWFFTPNRIVWENWEDFIAGGNHVIPLITSPTGGFAALTIYDNLGIPCAPQIDPAETININAMPLRAYNKIFNEWFRDQNLTTAVTENVNDGPDPAADYALLKRAKKHDYFTSCLPWPQKGTAVSLPLGSTAPVIANTATLGVTDVPSFRGAGPITWPGPATSSALVTAADNTPHWLGGNASGAGTVSWHATQTGLVTDLSAATAATINAIRTAFQVQRLLERDARGGTRYIELIQSHFGVRPPDFRLQRPEYVGGGRITINTHPVPQTSGTGLTDQETPQGNLAAYTTASGSGHNFSYAATEHGYLIGLANVRCDLTYQQGLRRHWLRTTRNDFYFPAFAHLGEQAVILREIFEDGGTTTANQVFGYQERWAEYRYTPNEITGLFKSTHPNTIDVWHYSEEFTTPPALNNAFIQDPSEATLARSLAVGEAAAGQQILLDVLHQVNATRPMPTYSVPGLIDHF